MNIRINGEDQKAPFFAKGYDAWIERWVTTGMTPNVSDCPARYMRPNSQERADFIKGWQTASRESQPGSAP